MKAKVIKLESGVYQVATRKNIFCKWVPNVRRNFRSPKAAEMYAESIRKSK